MQREKWLSGSEHSLPFQRTCVWLPDNNPLKLQLWGKNLTPPSGRCRHCTHTSIFPQTHIKVNLKQK